METFRLQISEEMGEERIDKCISAFMGDGLSRSFIQKLIKEEKLLVNGMPVKVSYRVNPGDEIYFTVPEPIEPDIAPEDIPLDILYEDEYLLIDRKSVV